MLASMELVCCGLLLRCGKQQAVGLPDGGFDVVDLGEI